MRRVEVVKRGPEHPNVILTVTDERVTLKVPDGGAAGNWFVPAIRVAQQIPLGTPPLRGTFKPEYHSIRMRPKRRSENYYFSWEEA